MYYSLFKVLRKWHVLFVSTLLVLSLTNCADDIVVDEVSNDPQLKAFNMLPQYHDGFALHYEGQINNDCIILKLVDCFF